MKKFSRSYPKYVGKGVCFFIPFMLLIFSLFSACEQPTWNDPVREYFEYYTETAAIEKYELLQEANIDKDGNVCLSPYGEETKEVLLYMRNPKNYPIAASGLGTSVTITQDSDDPSILHLFYTSDYLMGLECGGDIGGTIMLTETTTPREFNEGYQLKLKCNSLPPEINNVAIMSVGPSDAQTYVLAFERPGTAFCGSGGPYRDIVSITINGESYPVSIDTSGVMSFPNSKFTTTRPETLSRINRRFDHSPLAVYYLSGEPFIEGTKSYTIGYTDEAGLKSSITVDTSQSRLSAPVVKNNAGTVLSSGNSPNMLHIDSGDDVGTSTIEIEVPTTDEIDNTVENAIVHWELYKGDYSTVSENLYSHDSSASGVTHADVVIPGQDCYVIKVWATAPGYNQSAVVQYRLNLTYAQLAGPILKDTTPVTLVNDSGGVKNYVYYTDDTNKGSVTISKATKDVDGHNISGNASFRYAVDDGDYSEALTADQTVNLDKGQHTLKVKSSKTGFNDSDEETYIIKVFTKDIYIKSGGNNTSGDCTEDKPFATLEGIAGEIVKYNRPDLDYTIHVVGTVTGAQKLPNTLNGKAQSLTLAGTSNTASVLNGNGNATTNNHVTTLTVYTTVPVTIENLKITGGYQNAQNAGGIRVGSDTATGITVKLGNGALITGNTVCRSSSTGGNGGGVAVFADSKLFVYGTALITGNSAYYGGGINAMSPTSKIYLGYKAESTPEAIQTNYGVRENTASYRGGGIDNSGTLYIASGDIYGNTASSMGGGIANGNGTSSGSNSHPGTTIMIGGSISSNTATTGGGVSMPAASSTFTMSGDAYIPYGTGNDVYLSSGKTIAIGSDGLNKSNVATITVSSSTTRKSVVLSGSSVSTYYTKFDVSGDKWVIDSEGKLRLKNPIKVKYSFNISDTKASPSVSSFKLRNVENTTTTTTTTIEVSDGSLTSTKVKKPSRTGYINASDVAMIFAGWQYKSSGTTVDFTTSSTTCYPDDIGDYVDSSNEVTVNAIWSTATGNDIKSVWKNIKFDTTYYSNHDTFNVYTAAQLKQIFSVSETDSIARSSKTFDGKTINIMESIDLGDIQTSASYGDDGYNAWISFKGTLNGNGYGITANITGSSNVGLVYALDTGGTIKNLGLHGTVSGDSWTGAIVGNMCGGRIESCSTTSTITNTGSSGTEPCVGGIAGRMFEGTITGCLVLGTVQGKDYVGGIVGYGSGTITVSGNYFMTSDEHTGTVKYTGSSSSGKVGKIIGNGTLSNTDNTVTSSTVIVKGAATENTTGY